MRRHVLLATLVVIAGCAGVGGGGEGADAADRPVLTGTATPAELSETTRSETRFAESGRGTHRLNTTISATIQGDVELSTTREVSVTTYRVTYRRDDGGAPAVFGLYSVPAVKPFERADLRKNPASGEPSSLVERAQATYEASPSAFGAGTESEARLLGTETTATRYETAVTLNGTETPVAVTVATARHGGDYVTAVAVVPADESVPVARLLGGVRH